MANTCFIIFLFILSALPVNGFSQEENKTGKVIRVSGKSVTVAFENSSAKIGEEVDIIREIDIKDPVTKKVRGTRSIEIAKGIIDEFGIGKASIRITELIGNQKVMTGDSVVLTGKEKKITRMDKPVYKEILKISEESVETAFGKEDDVSEGDIFLIQRTEPEYDPETHEITGTNEVNVGKLRVSSASEKSSVAKPFDLKMLPQVTDKVVKESEYVAYMESTKSDSTETGGLREEVENLKTEISEMRAALDSLAKIQKLQSAEYEKMKKEITDTLRSLLSSDVKGNKIQKKNKEVIFIEPSKSVLSDYKKALDECLSGKFDSAIERFRKIIELYPDSELTENCRYWIGQSYFSKNDLNNAENEFNEVINDKRFVHKDDDAAIMLGITFFRMNKIDEAVRQFKMFMENYPESEYVNKVKGWIEKLS